MDKNQLLSQLSKKFSQSILEAGTFGRSEELSIWVSLGQWLKIAEILKKNPPFEFKELENLSFVEFEKTLVASYFLTTGLSIELRSGDQSEIKTSQGRLIVRISAPMPSHPLETIPFVSVQSIWPMAIPFEKEAAALFGVRYTNAPGWEGDLLPEGWKGFPLRKRNQASLNAAFLTASSAPERSSGPTSLGASRDPLARNSGGMVQ